MQLVHPVLRHVILKRRVPLLAFTDSAVDTANTTAYTFSGMEIGDPSADRLVIAAVVGHAGGGTAGTAPSSITIGGSAATVHIAQVGTGTNECSLSICSRVVAAGTTVDIVATWAVNRARAGVGVWTLKNYRNVTPVRTTGGEAESDTASLTTFLSTLEVGIVASTIRVVADPTASWTNAVEDFDSVLETGGGSISGGRLANNAGTLTASVLWTASESVVIAGAVWG